MLLKEKLQSASTIEVYELVLNGNISRFPELFWYGEDGKRKGLECLDYLLFTKLKWSIEDVPSKFSKSILTKHKLGGMLAQCFNNRPLECILALMGDTYQPWEYNVAPTNYWTKENAQFATRYMINKLNWSNEDIKANLSIKTFKEFGLASMLMKIYNSSPYNAINDIFPGEFNEWELKNVPLNFWTNDNCKKAIDWIIKNKLGNSYKNMSATEIRTVFQKNGLGYMLQSKFNNSIKKALDFIESESYKVKLCA